MFRARFRSLTRRSNRKRRSQGPSFVLSLMMTLLVGVAFEAEARFSEQLRGHREVTCVAATLT